MITLSAINLAIAVCVLLGFVFGVYLYFRNPQIAADAATEKLKEEMNALRKDIIDIKETHLRSVEADVKALTSAVAQLDRTVVRLTTIIDERIPKGSPGLTPPGV